MNYSLLHSTNALTLCLYLFVSMIVMLILGMISNSKKNERFKGEVSTIQSALFSLFSFILAVSFSLSGNRYENVTQTLTDESNKIRTAILNADLYPDSSRVAFRSDFKQYVENRKIIYARLADTAFIKQTSEIAAQLSARLWQRAILYSKHQPTFVIPSNKMLPALNDMFEAAEKRKAVLESSVPDFIFYMLFIMALVSSFIAGATSTLASNRDFIIIVCFALFSSMTVYATLDLGRPLRGIIKAQSEVNALNDLQKLFDQNTPF